MSFYDLDSDYYLSWLFPPRPPVMAAANPALIFTSELKEKDRFKGSDYLIWRVRMKAILAARGVWPVLDGTFPKPDRGTHPDDHTKWVNHNGIAMALLINGLDSDLVPDVEFLDSAADIWNQLETTYHSTNMMSLSAMRMEFYALKMKEGDKIAAHTSKFRHLRAQITSLTGHRMPEVEAVSQLLISLPPSYQSFVTAQNGPVKPAAAGAAAVAAPTVEDIIGALY